MRTIKKNAILLLIIIFVISMAGCFKEDKKILVVGTSSLTGDFIEGFSTDPNDAYVRDLIHGYTTLVENENGEYVWDTVAVLKKAPNITFDSYGNVTYKFELQEDLMWNNGENIKAKDYVASVMLSSTKEMYAIAPYSRLYSEVLGFNKYYNGEVIGIDNENKPIYDNNYSVVDQKFLGVRLLGEYVFSLTIKKELSSYYFEPLLVSCAPISYKTYLPGFEIYDSPDGAYITKETATKSIESVIKTTVNDEYIGQRFRPSVTCGPYQFERFKSKIAVLTLNPEYKTNHEGKKPKVDEIQIKVISQDTNADQVIAGSIDIVNNISRQEKINKVINSNVASIISYPKSKIVFLAMTNDFGPTRYQKVRQAIGYLINRTEFIEKYRLNQAQIINGPYLKTKWLYLESKDSFQGLNNYNLDISFANDLLNQSPYKYESDGITLFDSMKAEETNHYYRYTSEKQILEINYMGIDTSNKNPIDYLYNNAWKVGMKFTASQVLEEEAMNHFYNDNQLDDLKRFYHLFTITTSIPSNFEPYYYYHSSFSRTKNNPMGINDMGLDKVIETLKSTNFQSREAYKQNYFAFVNHFNELLPYLPLYNELSFDVYNNRVIGIETSSQWNWANDICDIDIKKI